MIIKITLSAGNSSGPYNIYFDQVGNNNILASRVEKPDMLEGYFVEAPDNISNILVRNEDGICYTVVSKPVSGLPTPTPSPVIVTVTPTRTPTSSAIGEFYIGGEPVEREIDGSVIPNTTPTATRTPSASTVVSVAPYDQIFEAETQANSSTGNVGSDPGRSGGAIRASYSNSADHVTYSVNNATFTGSYTLTLTYATFGSGSTSATIIVNGGTNYALNLGNTGGVWNTISALINLTAGNNLVRIQGNTGTFGQDVIRIQGVPSGTPVPTTTVTNTNTLTPTPPLNNGTLDSAAGAQYIYSGTMNSKTKQSNTTFMDLRVNQFVNGLVSFVDVAPNQNQNEGGRTRKYSIENNRYVDSINGLFFDPAHIITIHLMYVNTSTHPDTWKQDAGRCFSQILID